MLALLSECRMRAVFIIEKSGFFYTSYYDFLKSFDAKDSRIILHKRASLACAAKLADTSCPPEAPFGRLEVTLVNYKGDIISKYVHLSYKIDITRKITKFVNLKNFF